METSTTHGESIIHTARCTLQGIEANVDVKDKLEDLTRKTATLYKLIRNYENIHHEGISSDCEILNWTLPVVEDELNAAVWNLTSGFYKTAATCLRGALEMGLAALYFQILENGNFNDGEYNQTFADWNRGVTATPSWQEMEPVLKQHANAKDFSVGLGYCPINEVGQYLELLNQFAHNCSFSSTNGEGANILNMKSGASGHFSQEMFDRMYGAVNTTISIIASTWLTIYPQIIPELDGELAEAVKSLFVLKPAQDAFEFANQASQNM
ncbi:hypothetical protein K3G39_07150 [Pontibacter sp. HSC-14F20]|uniref:hypothetical protein n=1 Tax=Pontibacter sp. HSC-14F20 TaxID=2864136 RepID=UPI001C73C5D9|nr:hypothetical protein [Pontibacter sp. HSC-14F20]MBX0333011.1 hypothetical protein [Pontibacter sp. HSC-14F20]